MERQVSREDLLKLAAAAGGAGLLAGRAGAAERAIAFTKESGRLQVLDWAGYEVKHLWSPVRGEVPDKKPKFTFMTNEANALGKMRAGSSRTSSILTSATSRTSPTAASSSRGTRR